jgi:4-amino-4-deoxy-L-arabinose transferase-like glycosyltransferase
VNKLEIIISVIILVVGIFICWFLFWKKGATFSPTSDVGKRNIVISLISVGLLCRLIFTFCVPANSAPDEKAHVNYIKYISENKTLPVQPDVFDLNRGDYEYYQPPLYYLTMSLFYNLGNELNFTEDANIFQIRFLSVVLWLVTVIVSWFVVVKSGLNSSFAEIFVVALVSLLPSYMYISSMVNNDNLVTCLASLSFLVAIQSTENLNWLEAILFSIFISLVFLTKYTGIILLVFVIIFWSMKLKSNRTIVKNLVPIIFAFVIMSFLLIPFLLRNQELYNSLIPLSVGAHFPNWDSVPYGIYRALKNFLNTFWGVAGRTNDIKFIPAMVVGNLFALVALFGIAKGLFNKDSYFRKVINARKNILISLLSTVVIGFIMLVSYGVRYGHAQGRFLFPLIIPIAIWMAVGFKNVLGERVEKVRFITNTLIVFIMVAVTFTVYTIYKIHAI